MTSGVVHPLAPPSVRVTFGRYSFSANALDALTAIAVAGLSAAPTAANLPPKMSADQSPSVIDADVAASKTQTDPGASDGPVTITAAVTPSPWRRRSTLGVAAATPALRTNTRLERSIASE